MPEWTPLAQVLVKGNIAELWYAILTLAALVRVQLPFDHRLPEGPRAHPVRDPDLRGMPRVR